MTTKTTTATHRVNLSAWGYSGWLKNADISEGPVGISALDSGSAAARAAAAFGRRVARALGRGVYCCGQREDVREVRRDGTVIAVHFELTFGYSASGGGTDLVGRCWVSVDVGSITPINTPAAMAARELARELERAAAADAEAERERLYQSAAI